MPNNKSPARLLDQLEHSRTQIGMIGEREFVRLLGDGQGADGPLVGDGEAEPQAGRERLGERAQMDDRRIRLESGYRLQVRAAVAQFWCR